MSTTRKVLRLEITGESTSDLEIALAVIAKQIPEGYLSGFDSNDTGDYEYSITEEVVTPVYSFR